MTDFEKRNSEYIQMIDEALAEYLPESDVRQINLIDAMRYSIAAGGKRIRPVLVLETCRALGGDVRTALPFACAVEMIHTYSLIHDDLPCMDDDDLRRGKPSCHIQFGEDIALLAGDALLTLAFRAATDADKLSNGQICKAIKQIADYSGIYGMIGGQVMDLEAEGGYPDLEELSEMHALKTGALLRLSCALGAIAANAIDAQMQTIDIFAQNLGINFQITDDILDVTGERAELGKPVGSDVLNDKATYVTVLGLKEAMQRATEHMKKAREALSALNSDTAFLDDLCVKLNERRK